MIIRRASKEDVPAVSALWEQMVAEARPDWTPRRYWWADMAIKLLDMPNAQYVIFVALDKEEKLIGFADCFKFAEPSTGKLHGIGQHFYVCPEYRKGVLAGRLYKQLIEVAFEEPVVQVLDFFCFPEMLKFWYKRGYDPVRIMMRREVGNV